MKLSLPCPTLGDDNSLCWTEDSPVNLELITSSSGDNAFGQRQPSS